MNYSIDDMKMTGYKVLHPTIEIGKSIHKVCMLLLDVIILRWAYGQSPELFTLFLAIFSLWWIYKINKI